MLDRPSEPSAPAFRHTTSPSPLSPLGSVARVIAYLEVCVIARAKALTKIPIAYDHVPRLYKALLHQYQHLPSYQPLLLLECTWGPLSSLIPVLGKWASSHLDGEMGCAHLLTVTRGSDRPSSAGRLQHVNACITSSQASAELTWRTVFGCSRKTQRIRHFACTPTVPRSPSMLAYLRNSRRYSERS